MENVVFFYTGLNPTNGIWIDIEDELIGSWDDVAEAMGNVGYVGDEIMVADAVGLCRYFLYGESFDLESCIGCLESSIDDEVKAAYMECFGVWDEDGCESRYLGKYDSWIKYAEDYLDSTGELDSIPEYLQYYFDYEAYARDLRISGDIREDGGHFFYA